MRSKFRRILDNTTLKAESWYRMREYRKKAKVRLKRMNGGYDLGDEYKNIIVPYWKQFGIKPKKLWYKIFSDREQKVDPRYIPDDLWYGVIVPYFSNTQFRRFGEDKNQHDVFFKDLKRPQTIAKNVASVFYDENMNIIDQESAVELSMAFENEFLIKPSIDSGEGRLISFFEPGKFKREDLNKAMEDLKSNYIIQAGVKQHPTLSKLNPSSLNTVRIVTFLFKGEVHILSSILRMGASDSKVDNIGSGGFACPILEDGNLTDKGVNRKAEWVSENQHGVKFKDINVPSYLRIIEDIKREHRKLSHFKLIGWDFSVDTEGDPVFIEYNVCPGSNQITFGPTFGKLTDEVLQEVFIDKKLRYAQN